MMSKYTLWWVLAAVSMVLGAYVTHRLNNDKGRILVVAFICCGLLSSASWAGIARTSKSLMADSNLYDISMTMIYTLVLALLGETQDFRYQNWLGLLLSVLGVVLMKLKFG